MPNMPNKPGRFSRFKNLWNLFTNRVRNPYRGYGAEPGFSYRPDRMTPLYNSKDRSIVAAIYNRIAVDVASVNVQHCDVDTTRDFKYLSTRQSNLNECLTIDANLDQTGRNLIQDAVLNMFDEGVVAIVITDADYDPEALNTYDIRAIRVGRIVHWYPSSVDVECYDENTGRRTVINVLKQCTAIIQNPFYDVMNCDNSTLARLKKVLSDLDAVNNHASSGRLDLLIKLPYETKSQIRKDQADGRRKMILDQLQDTLGIAYIDTTEQVIQLNRPIENNLWKQAQDLTEMLFNELGLSPTIFNGTADEKVMNNYYTHTIEPLLTAITEEMTRKFLTREARSQGQRILFFRDSFKLVPMAELAEIVDKLSRNAILSPNEIRSILGFKPVEDEAADELRNRNLNKEGNSNEPTVAMERDQDAGPTTTSRKEESIQNE